MFTSLKQSYAAGYRAGRNGVSVMTCPHTTFWLSFWWREGWHKGITKHIDYLQRSLQKARGY